MPPEARQQVGQSRIAAQHAALVAVADQKRGDTIHPECSHELAGLPDPVAVGIEQGLVRSPDTSGGIGKPGLIENVGHDSDLRGVAAVNIASALKCLQGITSPVELRHPDGYDPKRRRGGVEHTVCAPENLIAIELAEDLPREPVDPLVIMPGIGCEAFIQRTGAFAREKPAGRKLDGEVVEHDQFVEPGRRTIAPAAKRIVEIGKMHIGPSLKRRTTDSALLLRDSALLLSDKYC
ncbi:hypothetical protein EV131_109241 [Rhizobium laguerreae]|uniref:Uncharacterized protein n=1 Tax=Rhizobium laguerreae TaxID=1076926 RepID=A0AAX2QII1_9HYPH|nr:hypothetical protein EV131_109241 [Rhizobium laguerreae]